MAITYKKCINCGSRNVIDILYGYPSYEAFLMAEEGKIKLGGCCITGLDPEYHCKDCNNEWNRQDAINFAYSQITGIKASVGVYFEGYYEIEINFQSRNLKWSHLGAGIEDHYEKILKQDDVEKFLEELKMLSLLNWKNKYIEPGVCDGTQWNVEIIRTGRNSKKHGDDKFPEEWDFFCKAINNLSSWIFS